MPLYEYICQACKTEFEELVRNAEEVVECPKCGQSDTRRQMSKFAFKSEGSKMRGGAKSAASCHTCRPGPGGCSGCS